MAGNFRITPKKRNGSLQLRLEGDFDGGSAHELLNLLRAKRSDFQEVIIDTDRLGNILAFGRVVFQTSYLSTAALGGYVVFTGRNAGKIAPGGAPVRSG